MNLEMLERICLSFPGTTMDIKWDKDICFLVGEKMFAVTGTDPPFKVSFKVSAEDYEELTELHGVVPAPYLARYNWVLVEEPVIFSIKEWKTFLENSYNLVFDNLSKKVKNTIMQMK